MSRVDLADGLLHNLDCAMISVYLCGLGLLAPEFKLWADMMNYRKERKISSNMASG